MTIIARFGRWTESQPPPQLSAAESTLVRWLNGEDVPIDAELAALIRREVSAMERYRLERDQQIKSVVTKLVGCATGLQPELNKPRRLEEQYTAGFTAGAYLAYSDAAQAVQDVLNAAVTEVQPDAEG